MADGKEAAEALFTSIGLEPKTAANVATNAKISAVLKEIINEAGLQGGCDKAIGNLLYQMVTKARIMWHIDFIIFVNYFLFPAVI